LHLLAVADDGGHKPQVFRMRWDQPLRRFARAYVTFREFGPGAELELKMSTANHTELDPASTAADNGLGDGDQVTFSKAPQAEGDGHMTAAGQNDSDLQQPAQQQEDGLVKEEPPATQAPRGAGLSPGADGKKGQARARKARLGAPKAKSAPKAKAKAKAKSRGKAADVDKAKAEEGGVVAARAKAKSKAKARAKAGAKAGKDAAVAENNNVVIPASEANPPVDIDDPSLMRGMARSQTVTIGPAKGWKVTVWLQDIRGRKNRRHDSAIRWRLVPPDRSRIYTKFTTVQKNVGEGVYVQLCTAVRPGLMKKILDRRRVLEGRPAAGGKKRPAPSAQQPQAAPPLPASSTRSPEHPQSAPQTPAARRPRKSAGQVETPVPMAEPPQRRSGALRNTGQGQPLQQPLQQPFAATQAYGLTQATPDAAAEDWSCGCQGHLRRHPRCSYSGNMLPAVVHLKEYMSVGRSPTCDIVLDSKTTPQMISRCHAVLNCEDGKYTLTDQASLNGVVVNAERLSAPKVLQDGDMITFGVPNPQPEFDYIFRSARP